MGKTSAQKRKTAINKVKNRDDKYRQLFESSFDAIMILTDKGFVDCNNATLKIFGCLKKSEFIGKHPSSLSPEKQPNGQDSRDAANQHIQNAVKNGSEFFEWVHKRIDGTDFPAEVLLTPVKLDGKNFIQATVRDVTRRKAVEKKLFEKIEESEKMNKLMVGRELKMIELKIEIEKLKKQIEGVPK